MFSGKKVCLSKKVQCSAALQLHRDGTSPDLHQLRVLLDVVVGVLLTLNVLCPLFSLRLGQVEVGDADVSHQVALLTAGGDAVGPFAAVRFDALVAEEVAVEVEAAADA